MRWRLLLWTGVSNFPRILRSFGDSGICGGFAETEQEDAGIYPSHPPSTEDS